jgi:hypothetical protein
MQGQKKTLSALGLSFVSKLAHVDFFMVAKYRVGAIMRHATILSWCGASRSSSQERPRYLI